MAPYRRLSLVLFALIAAVGLRAASAATKPDAVKSGAGPVMADEMVLGNPKAKVTMIEYASASCPHCARMNNDVIPEFKKKYVDTGKVRYVFREFLTPPEQFAGVAFLMARCAGQDQYFPILDDVFHDQTAIYESGDLLGGLLKIAAKHGLSKEQLQACTDEKAGEALNARVAKASKDGINATPTFIIGSTKIEGEKTLADLEAVVDPLLAK
jgi:protein-disulfide isomerase